MYGSVGKVREQPSLESIENIESMKIRRGKMKQSKRKQKRRKKPRRRRCVPVTLTGTKDSKNIIVVTQI